MRHDRSSQSISGRGGWVVASLAMSLLLLTVRAVAQTDWESPRHSTRIAGIDFWSTSDPADHDDPELKALMPNGGFVMTELYPYFAEGWHMWTVWRPRAQWAHSNGFTVITRLMYKQGSCVPGDDEGAAGIELFANWCGEMAQRDRMGEYCHIYIIGNEINHSAENYAAIDKISPQQYSWVYHACRKKIHEVYDGQGRKAVVLAASIGPWHPGNPKNGNLWFTDFFWQYLWYLNPAENTLLYDIYGDPMVDGFDIHAYGYHKPYQPNPTMDGTAEPNQASSGFQIFNWFSEVIQSKPD